MARLSIEGDKLVLRLSPSEKIAALQFHDITVPFDAIRSARIGGMPRLRVRLRGFSIGSRRIGLFSSKDGERVFVVVKGVDPSVVIYVDRRRLGFDAIAVDSSVEGVSQVVEALKARGLVEGRGEN